VPPARSAYGRGNRCLPPARNLFRIQATFAAEASQLDTAQPSGLDHRRQLVGRDHCSGGREVAGTSSPCFFHWLRQLYRVWAAIPVSRAISVTLSRFGGLIRWRTASRILAS
jgi:hypothetical protein